MRAFIGDGVKPFSIEETRRNYSAWVNERVNLVFIDPDGQPRRFLMPKRGNPAYMQRVNRRFDALRHSIEGTKIRVSDYSRALFVSLTLDREKDIVTNWHKIGQYWNNFITKLRNKFGEIDVIRCFESQSDGYPHIHALMFMPFHTKFFMHRNRKTGAKSYRVADRSLVDLIKSKWSLKKESLGFVDIQCFLNTQFALKYVLKYITKLNAKDEEPLKKGVLPKVMHAASTNYALLWRFQKRAFSISRRFIDLTRERLLNSNLLDDGLAIISPLSSLFAQKWEFLGIQTSEMFVPKAHFRERGKGVNSWKLANFVKMREIAIFNDTYAKWRDYSKFFNSAWFINQ